MTGFLDGLGKNFRGMFSQSSMNNLAVLSETLLAESQSGDLKISSSAQRDLIFVNLFANMLHAFVNVNPTSVNPDVTPHPAAPQVVTGAVTYPQPAAEAGSAPEPVAAAPAAPAAPAAGPTPTAPAPAPAEPAEASELPTEAEATDPQPQAPGPNPA